MPQSIEHLTLDFSSGHDLVLPGFEPHAAFCADSSEPGACFRFCVSLSLSLSLSLCLPLPCLCSLSLSLPLSKLNKLKKIFLKNPSNDVLWKYDIPLYYL